MPKRINYESGEVINGLTYLYDTNPYIQRDGRPLRVSKFRCICGKEFDARLSNIKNGNTKSCGCYKIESLMKRITKHGLTNHPLHQVWCGIKQRCINPNSKIYKWYGGRGITICDEWINNSEAFIRWGIENGYEKGLQTDRIDNDKGYSPNNCRFVTPQENIHNSKSTKYNWDIIRELRGYKDSNPDISFVKMSEIFGIERHHIAKIVHNEAWRI